MIHSVHTGRIKEILSIMSNHSGIAIKTNDFDISYSELNQRINGISKFLRENVKPGYIVAIINSSSWETCACFLAAINAECVALLIDKNWSQSWKKIVLDDAKPALILSQNKDLSKDAVVEPISGLNVTFLSKSTTQLSDQASYIIYTSGTTGQPKGVVNSIVGLTNLFFATKKIFSLNASDTILQFSSPSFDAWIWDLCMAFSTGASLAIPNTESRLPGNGLEEFIQKQLVTVATMSPSVLYHCNVQDFSHVHTIITAGERCPKEIVEKWIYGHKLYNAYGPSEAAVCATVHLITNDGQLPAIGKPIPGADIWLEDTNGQCVKPGERGEIVIGGKCVGLGYLNRPELNKKKFSFKPPVFHTGDCATQDINGVFHYEGRLDRQVKINGVRIEMEHVENILEQNKNVSRVFVTVDDRTPTNTKLIAFVLPKSGVSHPVLRSTLINLSRNNLPAKSSPIIIFVPDLPIRGSGKVDIQALISQYLDNTVSNRSEDLCQTIINIFQSCLGVVEVLPDDDFFSLGGNSLALFQCVTEIEKKIDTSIPIQLAIRNSTPKKMSIAIEKFLINYHLDEEPPITLKDIPKLNFPPIKQCSKKSRDAFVTGGTGLLGAHIIHNLLEQSEGHVYCLSRASSDSEAYDRIQNNLKKRGLWKKSYKKRISCFAGNIANPNFGFSDKTYTKIKNNIDVVYHIAANVNWVLSYSALESENTNGIKNAIFLCCNSGSKLVYVSSIGVQFSTDWHQISQFKESSIPPAGNHYLGYLRSKWVSEQIILSAIKHGITSYVIRPPFICDRVNSVKLISKDDFLLNKIQACISLGYIPKQGFHLDIYPADLLATGIISIATQEKYTNKVFQFTNPRKLLWSKVPDLLNKYGHKLQIIDYKEWVGMVVSKPGQLLSHLAYIKPISDANKSIYEHYHGKWPKVIDDNTTMAIRNYIKPPSVAKLLSNYLFKQK